MTAPPFKTALGQEELRQRTRKLSQRHRTVLLLVDGKRGRREVLALAEKAGVAASFYAELVELGMIEDGRESGPMPLADEGRPQNNEPPAIGLAAITEPRAMAGGPLIPEAAEADEVPEAEEAAEAAETGAPQAGATHAAALATDAAPEAAARASRSPDTEAAELEAGELADGSGRSTAEAEASLRPLPPAADAMAAAEPPPIEPAPAGPLLGEREVRVVETTESQVVAVEIAEPLTDEPLVAAPADDETSAGALPSAAPPPTVGTPLSLTLPPDLPAQNRPVRARVKFPAPADEPPPFARSSGSLPLMDLPAVLQAPNTAASAPVPHVTPAGRSPDADFQAEIDAEERLLAEVRNLLIGTLLVDGPVSGSLIALRVGRARRREELVALVWEVERALVRSRRPREAQARLIRARDLLGLGNTLVDDDSQFDRDTAW